MNMREAQPIDITGVPELLRIVEEVRATNEPRVLRRESEDVAVVMPLAPRRAARRAATTDDQAVERLLAGYGAVTPTTRPEHFGTLRRDFEEGVAEEVTAEDRR